MSRLFISIVLILAPVILAIAGDAPSRDLREIQMAESAILESLVISRNPPTQQLCAQEPVACVEDKAELGLALIAAKKSAKTNLANLLRYRFDAGLSTDYVCYVLRDREMSLLLNSLNPEALAGKCESDTKKMIGAFGARFDSLDVKSICRSADEISKYRAELLNGLNRKTKCRDGDF